jgi:hypothetical protein
VALFEPQMYNLRPRKYFLPPFPHDKKVLVHLKKVLFKILKDILYKANYRKQKVDKHLFYESIVKKT